MRRSLARWLLPALLLAGCSRSQPYVWPDFCQKLQRTIPPAYRFRDILLDLLENRKKYDQRFARSGGVDFFSYLDRSLRQQPTRSDAAIATQYVAEPKGTMPDQLVRITDACDENIRYYRLDGILV